jgi:hypothetical protein
MRVIQFNYLQLLGQHTEALFLTPANEGEVNQMRRKIKQGNNSNCVVNLKNNN